MGPSPKVAHPLRRAGGSERRWRAVVAANPPLLSPDLARPRLDPVEVGGRPSCGVVRGRRWAAAVHVGARGQRARVAEAGTCEAVHVALLAVRWGGRRRGAAATLAPL